MGKNWRATEKGYDHHFRIMREPCSVYRHYDEDGRLLYVGIARNPRRRGFQHKSGSSWGQLIARTAIADFPTRSEALDAEARAIAFELPIYNKKRPFRPLGLSADATKCPLLADLFLRKTPVPVAPDVPPRRRRISQPSGFDYEDWLRCVLMTEFYDE